MAWVSPVFLLWRVLGKSGGWVEAGTYGEERGNLHPHMAVLWGITCPSMD